MTTRYLISHYATCLLVGLISAYICKRYFGGAAPDLFIAFIGSVAFLATSAIKTQLEDHTSRQRPGEPASRHRINN